MSELSKSNGDSDVESNSSWTLLNEEVVGDNNDRSVKKDISQLSIVNAHQKRDEPETLIEVSKDGSSDYNSKDSQQELVMVKSGDVKSLSIVSTSSVDSLPEAVGEESENRKQGCLTYEEYLTERELSHDYEYDDRAEAWEHVWDQSKRGRRKCKKCKAENITTLTVVGAVLSLAGISLMCMMTPILTKQLAPDLQNRIEKNFTKVESSYATANGLKVYIDKSDKAMKLMENVDVLDPFIKQCSDNHMKATDHKPQKCDKVLGKTNEKLERPITHEQFLKEKTIKKAQDKEKHDDNAKETINKTKSEKSEKSTKLPKVTEEKMVKVEQPKKKELQNGKTNTSPKKSQKDQTNERKSRKEFKLKRTLDKANRYVKNTSKKMRNSDSKIFEEMKNLNYESEMYKQLEGTKSVHFPQPNTKSQRISKDIPKVSEPNFVLINSKATKPIGCSRQTDGGSIEKVVITPKTKGTNNVNRKRDESPASVNTSKNGIPKISPQSSWYDSIYHSEVIACQLLQDICMLKLTSKLREEAKAKQKKLKRKLEKKKSNSVKTVIDAAEPMNNEEKPKKRALAKKVDRTEDTKCTFERDPLFKQKPECSFKTKLNNNPFIKNSRSTVTLSNFDLLKELPFMSEKQKEKRESMIGVRPKMSPIEKAEKMHIHLPCGRVTKRCGNPRKSISFKDIVNNCEKSKTFLENTRRKNEEKLKMLEEIKLENRLKIEDMIRERRNRIKKDASLGIYKVQLPKYADVSEELRQLKKKKVHQGCFVVDSPSSSDSEAEKTGIRGRESKISCELMTALKVGKKVSDTFREWTLKKAPTLTCLKNYCHSKVSQISERLTNQCTNQTSIDSTVDNEELLALKARKEKHEQLKNFWRAKQEYLDKRIEICQLLKRKLSSEHLKSQTMSQSIQILDNIISDVLKNVKNCKSCIDRSCREEGKEAKNSSKSAATLLVVDKRKDDMKKSSEIVKREPFPGACDDIYSWLFERKATEIRKRDQLLWNAISSRPGHAERRKDVSKQDPAKGYHEKIVKKHN